MGAQESCCRTVRGRGMDAHTRQERQDDGICRLTLGGTPEAQALTSLRAKQVEALKRQSELVRSFRKKVGEDILAQSSNVKFCRMAVSKSLKAGPVPCERRIPPSEDAGAGADEASVDGLARVTGELQELCTEI